MYAQELLADPDFQIWSPAARGCWLTLSARCWADGSIPSDMDSIGRLCGESDAQAMLKHWSSIASKFKPHPNSPDKLISPRVEFERESAISRAEKSKSRGKAGATVRWAKAKLEKETMLEHCLSNASNMLEDATSSFILHPKEVPLTPKGELEPVPMPKRKRRTRAEILGPFPLEIREAVNDLTVGWREKDPADGRIITVSPEDLASNLQKIQVAHPEVSLAILVQSGFDYCKSTRTRYKAPQYFYGPEGPWPQWVQSILSRPQPQELSDVT
jgi:hypothetical protein